MPNPPPASTDLPKNGQPTFMRYIVLAWFCLAATISYVHRNAISVADGQVSKDLGLSMDQMGVVFSAFFLSYALGQLPAGWLADRFGTRRMLPLFVVVWTVASVLMALPLGDFGRRTLMLPALWEGSRSLVFSGALLWLVSMRLLMGAAQAGVFPASTNSLAVWFPISRRGLATGSLGSFMSVGSAAGAYFTGLLLLEMSWRWIFVLYALPGFVWAAWFYGWFRNRPEEHAAVNAAERALIEEGRETGNPSEPNSSEPTPWLALLLSWPLWCICGQQFFRAAGYIFYTTWFPRFLRESQGVSTFEAGKLTMLPLLAVVVGSLLGGGLSDRLYVRTGSRRVSRQWLAAASMASCALLILLASQVDNATLAVSVIALGSFCASFGGPCAYAITMDMGGRHVATVFSTMNMAGNLGAVAFPLMVPPLVRHGGWNLVLLTFAGIYLAAAACWLIFNPRGTIAGARPTSADAER